MRKWRPRWWRPATTRRTQTRLAERLSKIGIQEEAGPREEFRAKLRADLLTAYAEDASCPPPEPAETIAPTAGQADIVRGRPRRSRRCRRAGRAGGRSRGHRRVAVFSQLTAVGVAFTLTVTGLVAYRAVPGDTLYPLKRAAESTMVGLSTDERERAQRKLRTAEERAAEVARLLGTPGRVDLVEKTIRDMDRATRSAVCELGRVKRKDTKEEEEPTLRRFAEKQHQVVDPMLQKMDAQTQRQASGYLDYIDGLAAPETTSATTGD
ncbi:DUF5667 domain-containing protein [Spongiactinospora gelatinilytica]|uniref:DUF5667 domain-containing protein n=1 Tax=Spongiactinospora gelatinilytica TaxID=2666298 RepID=UPI0011B949E1|nr:DUF5667 domain-containing protein [Spongiactinospora gelatinilytica]